MKMWLASGARVAAAWLYAEWEGAAVPCGRSEASRAARGAIFMRRILHLSFALPAVRAGVAVGQRARRSRIKVASKLDFYVEIQL